MNKKQNAASNDSELRELFSFRSSVDPAVYAGVKEQESWEGNRMVTPEDFELAAARFMAG